MGRKNKHCTGRQDLRIYEEEYLRWLQLNKSVVIIDKEEVNIDTVEGFYDGQ